MTMTDKAVVLLSGGLDSATSAAIAKAQGHALYALTFLYGQRHDVEAEAARRVASAIGVVDHIFQTIDLRAFGGSALTADIDVPKSTHGDTVGQGIPVTYVPARNTIFLSFALAYAEVVGAAHIYIGVNAVDYSGYPDCRPAFVAAFQHLARHATKAGVEGKPISIQTPLINLTKAQIIEQGTRLGLDYGLTHSCYDPLPDGRPCGTCESCHLRLRGFREAGMDDPTRT